MSFLVTTFSNRNFSLLFPHSYETYSLGSCVLYNQNNHSQFTDSFQLKNDFSRITGDRFWYWRLASLYLGIFCYLKLLVVSAQYFRQNRQVSIYYAIIEMLHHKPSSKICFLLTFVVLQNLTLPTLLTRLYPFTTDILPSNTLYSYICDYFLYAAIFMAKSRFLILFINNLPFVSVQFDFTA